MPSSNSTRRVAKAARSSGKRASSSRATRSLIFPVAVAIIIIVGIVVVVAGRDRRVEASTIKPQIGDHIHTAYGIYICDDFISALTDRRDDTRGIHTHGDGIIHVHPFSSIAAGKKATLSNFFWMTKMEMTNDKIVLPGGETWQNGKTCPNGKAGKVVLVQWANVDDTAAKPEVITSNFGAVRLEHDRGAITMAFVPEDEVANIPQPTSVPTLDSLSDLGATQAPATTAPGATAPGATDTTAPGATASTAPGATDTSAPGATGATATTVPATTATTAGGGG